MIIFYLFEYSLQQHINLCSSTQLYPHFLVVDLPYFLCFCCLFLECRFYSFYHKIIIRLGRCFVYFLYHATACSVILLFALVAFLPICRTLSWFVNSPTKFTFFPVPGLSWFVLIFFLLSIIWSSFLSYAFLHFWFLDMPPTFLSLFISLICIFVISSIQHMLIAFSSVISTPFLSRTSLILCDLIPSTTFYSSKLSCRSPNSHVDARFLSSVMNWSNVSSSCSYFKKNFLLSTTMAGSILQIFWRAQFHHNVIFFCLFLLSIYFLAPFYCVEYILSLLSN